MSTELKIRTPEGVVFTYSIAGPVVRCIAWFIDFAVVMFLLGTINTAAGYLGFLGSDIGQAFAIIASFVLWIGYGVLLETIWRGQTLGKQLFRLRVMDAQGLRLEFHQVLLRNLLRPLDCLPALYLVGGIVSLFNRKAQRVGDIVAGTVVVHNRELPEPDLEQLLGAKYNSLREHASLVARLRQRVSPEEAWLGLEALMRREDLEPEQRLEIFAELADHFSGLADFPAELRESMPNEQFVRNVVDVLFRSSGTREMVQAAVAAR